VRVRVRVCARVSSYRDIFLCVSTLIRNNPPGCFQNIVTGSVRNIDIGAIAEAFAVRHGTLASAYFVLTSVTYATFMDLAGEFHI
jgi:hypothetical protein